MKPVDQEFAHDPENGLIGDCWRACLASLLERPISCVPHFLAMYPDDEERHTAIQAFLMEHGYFHIEITRFDFAAHGNSAGYHMIYGPSPRFPNIQHAVIGKDGVPVFDPHPSRTMLAGNPEDWTFGFLVSTCGRHG